MRGSILFRPMTQKENVYAAQRLKLQKVANKLAFQIIRLSLHGRKTLDLTEEGFSQKTLEVAHEAEAVPHTQGRERILRKDMQAREQIITRRPLRHLAKHTV